MWQMLNVAIERIFNSLLHLSKVTPFSSQLGSNVPKQQTDRYLWETWMNPKLSFFEFQPKDEDDYRNND